MKGAGNMDSNISRIIDKALGGGLLSAKEGIELLSWDDLSVR